MDTKYSYLTSLGYQIEKKIGAGAYGDVYLGKNTLGEEVAIKETRPQRDTGDNSIHFTTIREIRLLQEINHENIVKLHNVVIDGENATLWLVVECMSTDLQKIIHDRNIPMPAGHIKSYMNMILKGVEYLHRNWCLHRDLSPQNLLISTTGQLKLADFGLARFHGERDVKLSPGVVTRWYRAPELLFGSKFYGYGVDMWAVACIMAEMMLRNAFLPGDDDMHQIATICAALGTPTEDPGTENLPNHWPNVSKLPAYIAFQPRPYSPFNASPAFKGCTQDALDLLASFFVFDPTKRLTAQAALTHAYFRTAPAMTPHTQLPIKKPSSEKL